MNHVCVTNYFDVWGNKKEGFTVNNWCHDVYDTKSAMETKDQFLRFLKRINFLIETVRKNSLIWEDLDSGYVLYDKDYCPICMVEILDEERYQKYYK